MKKRMVFLLLILLFSISSVAVCCFGRSDLGPGGEHHGRTEMERRSADVVLPAAPETPPVVEPMYLVCEVEYIEPEKPQAPEDIALEDGTVSEEPIRYTDDDVFCMAAAVYQEAGGDACCDECRYRVADVILNRVADERYSDTIRGVLEEYMQYGMFWDTGVCFPERANEESEQEAVKRAYAVALDVLSGNRHSGLYGSGYVYQAEFSQGTDVVTCCGIYFGR